MRPATATVERVALAPGYTIARVINGCWQLAADHGGGEAADLRRRIDTLIGTGFTTFDCADIYTGVEELLGEVGRGRAIQVHTKFVPDLEVLPNLTRADVVRGIDRSLSRLHSERLDLVQFHWWDYGVPGWIETAGWLGELVTAGKIRCLGLTNFDAEHVEALLDAGAPLVSNQVQVSLLDQRVSGAMTTVAVKRNLALFAYGSLAGGFLTDTWREKPAPTADHNRSQTKYRLIVDEAGGWSALQRVLAAAHQVARRYGVSVANVAARWVLDRPGVAAVILGLGRGDRVAENHRLFTFSLDDEDRALLSEATADRPGPAGPVFGLERQPGGKHEALLKKNLGGDAS